MTRKEIYQALADGKQMQTKDSLGWMDASDATVSYFMACTGTNLNWIRIKPTAKRVPLGPEDVPLGAWFQQQPQCATIKQAMVTVERDAVYLACRETVMERSFVKLMEENWLYTTDGGKTWTPCWKEEA